MKNKAAVALGKLSRRKLTAKRRKEIARLAARARWERKPEEGEHAETRKQR